jgi:Flp pilus assembly protein TadB
MKKLIMMLMMAAFCFSASAMDVPQQDTTKTSRDTSKKQMKKKPASKTKSMKKKNSSKKDSLKNSDNRTDTTTRPMHK